jgi:protein SCO1/2
MKTKHEDRKLFALAATGAAAVLLMAGLLMWAMKPGTEQIGNAAGVGGPFRLVDGGGGVVTERSFPGKYLVVYFGYTTCRDICPATLGTLAAAMDRLGRKASLVQPLFITIDPARDTPPVMQRYVAAFGPRLIGLSGTPAALRQVAEEYHVTSVRRAGSDELDHSAVLYLIAPDGSFVAPVPADASESVMAQVIARYVS